MSIGVLSMLKPDMNSSQSSFLNSVVIFIQVSKSTIHLPGTYWISRSLFTTSSVDCVTHKEKPFTGHGCVDRVNGEASDPPDLRACSGIVQGESPGSLNDKFISKIMTPDHGEA